MSRLCLCAPLVVLLQACGVTEGPLLTTRPAPPTPRPAPLLLAWGAPAPRTVADLNEVAGVWSQGPAFDGLVLSPGVDSPWQAALLDVTPALALEARLGQPPYLGLAGHLLSTRMGPGSVDDEDDVGFSQVAANFGALARAARRIGARGVMLDTQTYDRQLFSFAAVGRGRAFDTVQASMRRRGEVVMRAMLAEHPDALVVVTLGYADVFRAACLDGLPLEAERYGLLPAFLDGMRDALAPGFERQLVDGFLPAYATRDGRAFSTLRSAIAFDEAGLRAGGGAPVSYRFPRQAGDADEFPWRTSEPWRCSDDVRAQLTRTVGVGFGVMVDFKSEPFDAAPFSRNFHSPAGFGDVLRAARREADSVVWVFSAQVDWWSRPGWAPLPPEYRAAFTAP
ncbi:MAG: hypothetical protein SFW67_34615 [Myxococcaceae bacterium]|nr:hypothetical protein [Myxococcaceae bacterium]